MYLGLSHQEEGLDYVLCRKMGRKEITMLSGIDKTEKAEYSMFLSAMKSKVTRNENRSEVGAGRKGNRTAQVKYLVCFHKQNFTHTPLSH